MLRLVQPENVQFRTVFRVIAYSAAPTVVCVVPLVGPLVGSIWFGVCCFIGCKYSMRRRGPAPGWPSARSTSSRSPSVCSLSGSS